MSLSPDALDLALDFWFQTLGHPSRRQQVITLIDAGAIDVPRLVRQAPEAPWVTMALAGLAGQSNHHHAPDPVGLRLVNVLLEAGAKAWVPAPVRTHDYYGSQLLVPKTLSASVVESLIRLGDDYLLRTWLARPDAPTAAALEAGAEKPGLVAAAMWRPDLMAVLVEHGCSPNTYNADGLPPLALATHTASVDQLLALGASLRLRTAHNQSIMDVWSQKFTLDSLAPFRKIWEQNMAGTTGFDSLRLSLPLSTKGAFGTALRRAGIKGHELDAQGLSLLDIAAAHLVALSNASQNAKYGGPRPTHSVLLDVWHRAEPTFESRPEGLHRFLVACMSFDDGGLRQWAREQFVQHIVGPSPTTAITPESLGLEGNAAGRASHEMAMAWLMQGKDFRPWVEQEPEKVMFWLHEAFKMPESYTTGLPLLFAKLREAPRLWVEGADDPWALVLPRLTARSSGYPDPHADGLDDNPISNLARLIMATGRIPAVGTWERWEPVLKEGLRQSPNQMTYTPAWVELVSQQVHTRHVTEVLEEVLPQGSARPRPMRL